MLNPVFRNRSIVRVRCLRVDRVARGYQSGRMQSSWGAMVGTALFVVGCGGRNSEPGSMPVTPYHEGGTVLPSVDAGVVDPHRDGESGVPTEDFQDSPAGEDGGRADTDEGDVAAADARETAVSYDWTAFLDGSFEMGNGWGWDTCGTRTPGSFRIIRDGSASEGDWFARFTTAPCQEMPGYSYCSPSYTSDAQVFMWFGDHRTQQPRTFDHPTSLYFDMIDLAATPPTGMLHFYRVNNGCEGTLPLADVRLDALSLGPTWTTHCVPLPLATIDAIGIAVTGGLYDVGMDALRLGPPCP